MSPLVSVSPDPLVAGLSEGCDMVTTKQTQFLGFQVIDSVLVEGDFYPSVCSLIQRANKMKECHKYVVANRIVDILLCWLATTDDTRIRLEWEKSTNNEWDAYYDLLTIVVNEDEDLRLCIPIPLLQGERVADLLRETTVVDRMEHNRVFHPENEEMRETDVVLLNEYIIDFSTRSLVFVKEDRED